MNRPASLIYRRHCVLILMLVVFAPGFLGTRVAAQDVPNEAHRKAVLKVAPDYSGIAKTLKLTGTVRLAVKVAPSGKVLSAEVIGGHPVLAQSAINAVLQWRYEAASQQTSEVAAVNFGN